MTASQTRGSQALRALALMGLGLGLTWAAGQWSGGPPSALKPGSGSSSPASTLAQEAGDAPAGPAGGGAVSEATATESAAGEAQAGAAGGPATAADGEAPAPTVEDISTEELEAEIRELERAVGEATGGSGPRDPGEIAADKPLSADTAISLPSDI